MKKYSPFLKKLVIAGLISAGSVSAVYAQSPVQDGAGVQPPSQTLFQEQTAAPSPAPSLADSNATGGQKGETILNSAPTLSVTDTAAAPAADQQPPSSLSTYLNQENSAPVAEEKAAKSANGAEMSPSAPEEPQIPGVDPNAPVSQYRHNDTGEDNADSHLKRQIMGREVVVAITNGKLDFGPWEQIFYGEFDGRRRKRVLVKVIGE